MGQVPEKPRVFRAGGKWNVAIGDAIDYSCDEWAEAIDVAIGLLEDTLDDVLRHKRFLDHCDISNDMREEMNVDDPEEPVPALINPERIELHQFAFFISYT